LVYLNKVRNKPGCGADREVTTVLRIGHHGGSQYVVTERAYALLHPSNQVGEALDELQAGEVAVAHATNRSLHEEI
jgi:hypothetical protein